MQYYDSMTQNNVEWDYSDTHVKYDNIKLSKKGNDTFFLAGCDDDAGEGDDQSVADSASQASDDASVFSEALSEAKSEVVALTGVRIMPTSKAPGPRPELIQRQRSELIRKRQIKPQHFVGRDVFKHFDSDDCVWHGRVLETFRNKHLPENC